MKDETEGETSWKQDIVDNMNSGQTERSVRNRGGDIEEKMDEVKKAIDRLGSDMKSMELRTDTETIGRVASDGQRNRISDRDPMA